MVFLVIAVGCTKHQSPEQAAEVKDKTEIDEMTAEVQVMPLAYTDLSYELLSNGSIAAMHKADLRFQSQEIIRKIYVKNGDRVVKGQQLAALDQFKLESSLRMSENAFGRAELELQDVLIGQGYSLKDSANIPAEVLRIAKIRSGYTQEQNNLNVARYNLDAATLYAPFDGVVANLTAKEFNQPGSEAFCTLIDNRHPEVVFNILENELSLVKLNDKVIVSPFSQAEYELIGKVTEINPLIDKNGMVRIKAVIANPEHVFVEGMHVKVRVQRVMNKQLVIPKTALVLRSNRKVVFTLNKGKAMWNYVQTAQENSDSYVVTEGVHAGDTIIYSGNINLAHEAPVIVNP